MEFMDLITTDYLENTVPSLICAFQNIVGLSIFNSGPALEVHFSPIQLACRTKTHTMSLMKSQPEMVV